jgi:uncharacterized protein YqgC (DUF456 family)
VEWILFVVAALFFLLGGVCVLTVLLGLPGGWMIVGLAVLIEWADALYLPAGEQQTFSWWLLGAAVIILILGEILEFIAGALGARQAGSSRRGAWGALGGGVAGAILGVFIPIPIVGSLIGAVIGTFAGAIIAEMTTDGATVRGSLKPATGATIGRILGTLAKMPIAIAVWLGLTAAAFLP